MAELKKRYFVNNILDYIEGPVNINAAEWKNRILHIVDLVMQHQPSNHASCDGGLYVGCAGECHTTICDYLSIIKNALFLAILIERKVKWVQATILVFFICLAIVNTSGTNLKGLTQNRKTLFIVTCKNPRSGSRSSYSYFCEMTFYPFSWKIFIAWSHGSNEMMAQI